MPERAAAPPLHGRRVLVTAAFLALVICPLVAVAIASTSLFRPGGRILEVEMRTSSGNAAEIYWSSDYTFSAGARATAAINQAPGEFARIRFRLPDDRFEVLRFDPMNGEGEAVIRGMRVLDDHGRVVRTIDPLVLRPFHEVTRVTPAADGVRVLTTPGATDPMMILNASWLAGPSAWRGLRFVTPLGLAWIGLAALALLATAIGVVMKDAMRESFDHRTALWLAALVLVVVWAKALVLLQHPVPVPFWDQWDGEGTMLYIPWSQDGLTWRQMFALHSEHRIFFSRLLAVALLVLNGQWDPHLQILVNAGILALAAVVLAVVLWMAGGRRRLPLVVGLVALAVAPPLGLENSLHGFQSAFYLLLLFSLLAIWLMIAHEPGTPAWWLGVACAFCSLFTVAGGALVIVPVALASVMRAMETPRRGRQMAITGVALAAVAAVAVAATSPPIAYHESLKAVSWPAFIQSLGRNLALPWINAPALAPFLWLPLAIVAGVVLRRRLQSKQDERLLLALGAWILCQAVAIAYARGGDGVAPASRYLDLLGLGLVVNSLALATWLAAGKRFVQIGVAAILCVWLGGLTAGIVSLSRETLATHGRQRERGAREHVRNIRAFVATDDIDELLDKIGPRDLPYNNAWLLANWLQHPYIRQVLPAIVRPPLGLQAAGGSSGFVPGHAADYASRRLTFDSYGDGRETNTGSFESQPVACSNFRHLRFEVAGSARDGGLDLGVRDAGGHASRVSPAPGTRPGWTGVFVRCPAGNFSVVASDRSPLSWMAFTPPTEIAAGSMFAAAAIERAPLIGYAALACVGLALASALAARSAQRPPLTAVARGDEPAHVFPES